MEKCSFCIQRIHSARDEAKNNGRPIKDGEVKTACQQSCPADAIVFGNINDPTSEISKTVKNPRGYHVLRELNVRPSVTYLTRVRNTETV
jgi:molybdopterin-containing oxidoreductase family iron-sulfur binding subunit